MKNDRDELLETGTAPNLYTQEAGDDLRSGHARRRPKKEQCLLGSTVALGTSTLVFFVLMVLAFTREKSADPASNPNSDFSSSANSLAVAADLAAAMDTSVDPCQDFYEYACGGWIDSHPIPDDKSAMSTFGVLDESLETPILVGLQKNTNSKSFALYSACLNQDAIDEAGYAGLPALLNQFQQTDNLTTDIGKTQLAANWNIQAGTYGLAPLFYLAVYADDKHPSNNSVRLGQSGLGLSSREAYLATDEVSVEAQKTYRNFIKAAFNELNYGDGSGNDFSADDASAVYNFERQLAQVFLPAAALRDPDQTYNPTNVASLPSDLLDWSALLAAAFPDPQPTVEQVIVQNLDYLSDLTTLLVDTEPAVLQNYFRWHLLQSSVAHLGKPFQQIRLDYLNKTRGVSQFPPRFQTCLSRTSTALGFELSSFYVKSDFSPDTKQLASDMIKEIIHTFQTTVLDSLSWMDDVTRVKASEKAAAMTPKIGYPDWLLNQTAVEAFYAEMVFGENPTYFEMIRASWLFDAKRARAAWGQPVDKSEWLMIPSEVNAYYQPTTNEITFPAGILNSPFFSSSRPMSVNFGGIGVVMGHEITHGFDDQGAKYDKTGVLKPWWTQETFTKFQEKTDCIREQYSQFEVNVEGQTYHVNGTLTLGENIADNGGLKEALNAYHAWTETHTIEKPPIGLGLSHDQLFFVGFAQVWCGNYRPALQKERVFTDPHSPHKYRVIGTLSNSADFAKAFQCPAGSPMNPEKKCVVW